MTPEYYTPQMEMGEYICSNYDYWSINFFAQLA